MNANPLQTLHGLQQSVWLDYIDRTILEDGSLKRLISEDSVAGLTSNPAIFEKAIAKGGAYSDDIAGLNQSGASREQLYERLVVDDIAAAADQFRPLYDASQAADGYVSIEVSPLLARDTDATIAEARMLWAKLDRPNIMIKVPGTVEGLPAIRTLLAEGINLNVTLLFSVGRYLRVLDAYMDAMEDRQAQGLPLQGIASVASFFLSRIDVLVDARLDALAASAAQHAVACRELRGQAAIASAAYAYLRFQEMVATPRWQKLAQAGAALQRLLWASTGVKDPAYSDVKYIEALIAPHTVNTLPMETLAAYRDHGQPELRIEQSIAAASGVMHGLTDLGIDLHRIDDQLEAEGIEKFVSPYQKLLSTLGNLAAPGTAP